jgi:hypothetical protein
VPINEKTGLKFVLHHLGVMPADGYDRLDGNAIYILTPLRLAHPDKQR